MANPTPTTHYLFEALRDPAAYPHPVREVLSVQTHTSCVFLTGDYAYKVKKAVTFDFLDYSALDTRRDLCHRELELNRRLCPELYLDVVPIVLDDGRIRVDRPGEPIEWAVRMHQLRADEMLPRRIQEGRCKEADVLRLAEVLVKFHAEARCDPEIDRYGLPSTVSSTILNTLHTMDSLSDTLSGGAAKPTYRSSIRRFLESWLASNSNTLLRRVEHSRIRDCHGDLRLQNICFDPLYDGGIQVFDCIEFNTAFRYIDTAADIAYLAMDLDLAGRADLSRSLIERYKLLSQDNELSNSDLSNSDLSNSDLSNNDLSNNDLSNNDQSNKGLISTLGFYRVYRACVRGNIAMLAAADPEIDPVSRAVHNETACAAYDLAACSAHQPHKPALFITSGFSGSGKSTLAKDLCRRLPAICISSDQVRKELASVGTNTRLTSDHYTVRRRSAVYSELHNRARKLLSTGVTVLLDATFLSVQERRQAANVAAECQADFWILHCSCSDSIIRGRLKQRIKEGGPSDANLDVYELQRAEYNDIASLGAPLCSASRNITIDTSFETKRGVETVIAAYLSEPSNS